MSSVLLSIGVEAHNVVRHNLPWLAVLAMLLGFGRDEADFRPQPDELNG